jgi:RNA polymerase sigma factor (sigma-70 family)
MASLRLASPEAQAGYFATTHWSVVLEAGGDSSERGNALETLCRTYWYPIYVYIRRDGHPSHDAQDLTQEFFSRLLRLNSLDQVSPAKGKFRTFLLVSLKHFLSDARDAAGALKRGGGRILVSLDDEDAEKRYELEPSQETAPDVAFDRRWLRVIMEQALVRLQEEHTTSGKARYFAELKMFLDNPTDDGEYERAAAALGINAGAVAVAVHRLRQRYRDLVRAGIANTVSSPAEFADELRHLLNGAPG